MQLTMSPRPQRTPSGRTIAFWTSVLATTVVFIALALPASAAPKHDRSKWLVGVGFLLGSGDVEGSTGFESGWVAGVTPGFRLGYMAVEQRLMVSVENKQWTREAGNLPENEPPPGIEFVKYQVGSQVYNLVLTAFPASPESPLGGLYLNIGAGPAVARVDTAAVDTLFSGEDPVEMVSYEWGWGGFAGGGYEFRFVPNVAAGLSVNFVYSSIKGEYIDRTRILSLAATLNWYF